MSHNDNSSGKPTVLAVGLFVPGTGFTRVFETLFTYLSSYFSIHWMGIGYKGDILTYPHYTLYPVNKNGGDIYGAYGAASLATTLNTRQVLLLNDFYMLKNYQRMLEQLKEKGIRLTAYVPLDGSFTNSAIAVDCLFLDEMVLYNRWALQEATAAIDKYKEENKMTDLLQPALSYIYHGTDTTLFAAVNKKREHLKQEIFKLPDAANSIFILNANRYNERKDIEATIEAFALALPGFSKPTYLCLHTPNLQPQLYARLLTMIANSGCKERIVLNPLGDDYCTTEQLVQLYTGCDIGVNTGLGEGWGMISFEHAACGAAQVVPNHTAPAEVWKDAAILVPAERPVQLSTNPFLMHAVDTGALANELLQLVNDDDHRNRTAAACLAHVRSGKFNWQKIAEDWVEKLKV